MNTPNKNPTSLRGLPKSVHGLFLGGIALCALSLQLSLMLEYDNAYGLREFETTPVSPTETNKVQ